MNLGTILDVIKIWVESAIITIGYPGLTLVMFLENIFPPIPSEVVLPLAGSLTNSGHFTIVGVVLWGMVGALVGALIFYALGKWISEDHLRVMIEKYGKFAMLNVDDFDRAVDFFNRHGELTIFFGRMVPIVRSLISIPAGLVSMNLVKFCFYTILGTSLWNLVLSFAGRLLGKQWPLVMEWVGIYQNIVLLIAGLAVAAFIALKLRRYLMARSQIE